MSHCFQATVLMVKTLRLLLASISVSYTHLDVYKRQELNALIDDAIAEVGGEASMKQMGQIMKAATAKAAGRVDGKRLSTAVKSLSLIHI